MVRESPSRVRPRDRCNKTAAGQIQCRSKNHYLSNLAPLAAFSSLASLPLQLWSTSSRCSGTIVPSTHSLTCRAASGRTVMGCTAKEHVRQRRQQQSGASSKQFASCLSRTLPASRTIYTVDQVCVASILLYLLVKTHEHES